jgi:DNA-binding SARP family transcriptional activator
MHFGMKSYLKSNRYHTVKHSLNQLKKKFQPILDLSIDPSKTVKAEAHNTL